MINSDALLETTSYMKLFYGSCIVSTAKKAILLASALWVLHCICCRDILSHMFKTAAESKGKRYCTVDVLGRYISAMKSKN